MRLLGISPIRLGWAANLALVLACVGCGPAPEPEFVYAPTTNSLDRDAQRKVQGALLESFGTPLESVAWLRMPVNFGIYDGEVTKPVDKMGHELTIKWLAPEEERDARLKELELELHESNKTDFSGAGLLWQNGPYVNATEANRKNNPPVAFEVLGYDPAKDLLTINAQLSEGLEAGTKFRIVGTVLQHGRRVYMQHCVHCHGVSGDGNGPTAQYLNPLPRDYRLGLFKFTSTPSPNTPPRRADLHRIIQQGIPGTYMPSFLLLAENDLDSVIEYIRWLSMRGMVEQQVSTDLAGAGFGAADVAERLKKEKRSDIYDATFAADFETNFESFADTVASAWTTAEDQGIIINPKSPRVDPAKDPDSIARGRKLYLSDKTKCVTCHGPTGRGDGPQTVDFQQNPDTKKEYLKPGLFDAWGHPLKPRDLTSGIYRGGRRPVDLYRRVRAGIKGTPMPAFASLTEEEVWDIVNYVMSVPYDGKAPPALPAEDAKETGKEKVATTGH